MTKNIIICCDGTGNQFNETYSNVIKLFRCIKKDPFTQVAFYDPGVGTLSDPNLITPWGKYISKIGGLAFGWGLKENVREAYGYLMENYQPGDRIFIFGFSRGAYTARVIAGMIHQIGLLEKGCQNLFPYAWEAYKKSYQGKNAVIAAQFKKTYSRNIQIYFVGVWDTVTSFGIFNRKKLPSTTYNPSIQRARHAVAIDERRTYYRQNLFATGVKGQDLKQVWFAGVHSDVGGSYPFLESGLSQITLEWMLAEASEAGLQLDESAVKKILYDATKHSIPDHTQEIHTSLTSLWWVLEFTPRRRKSFPFVYFPSGRRRQMYFDFEGKPVRPLVHESVIAKIQTGAYKPANFDPGQNFDVSRTVSVKMIER